MFFNIRRAFSLIFRTSYATTSGAVYAFLDAWGIGVVGLAPALVLLCRLRRVSRLSEGVQFST
jgi:uncharacterized membrane protein YesL